MFNPNAIGVGAHADGVAVKHLTLGRAKYSSQNSATAVGVAVAFNWVEIVNQAGIDQHAIVSGQNVNVKATHSSGNKYELVARALGGAIAFATGDNSNSKAFAGTISVNYLNDHTEAVIGGFTTGENTTGLPTTVIASQGVQVIAQNDVQSRSLGGALGLSGDTSIGGAFVVNVLNLDTLAAIRPGANVDAAKALTVSASASLTPVTGNGKLDQFAPPENPSAVALGGGGSGGTAVAGSVIVDVLTLTTQAFIGAGANINAASPAGTADQDVTVSATEKLILREFAGAIAVGINNKNGSDAGGAGAGLHVGVLTLDTQAFIGQDATVKAGGDISVQANADEAILSIAASAGLGKSFGVGGAVTVQVLTTTTRAFIANRSTGATTAEINAKGNVFVQALHDLDFDTVAGTLALSQGNVAVGVSNSTFISTDVTEAFIGELVHVTAAGEGTVAALTGDKDATTRNRLTENVSGVIVNAVSWEDVQTIAVGGAASESVSVAGSATVNKLRETTRAFIGAGATIDAKSSVSTQSPGVTVRASDQTRSLSVAGGAAITSGSAGIGAAADVAVIDKVTHAFIAHGTTVAADGHVRVSALLKETMFSIGASGGFANTAGISAAASIYVVSNSTRAFLGDDPRDTITPSTVTRVTADGSIVVEADDLTELNTVGGTLAFGGTAGVGAAAGVSVFNKTTEAFIGAGTELNANANPARGTLTGRLGKIQVTKTAQTPPSVTNSTTDSDGKLKGDGKPETAANAGVGGDGFRSEISVPGLGSTDVDGDGNPDLNDDSLTNKRQTQAQTSNVTGVTISATSADTLRNLALSGGAAGTAAVQAGAAVSVINTMTDAFVGSGAKINTNPSGADAAQSVTVAAASDFYHLGIAGAASFAGVAAVAPGVDVSVVNNTTLAHIDPNADVRAKQDVLVSATVEQDIVTVGIGLAAAGSVAIGGAVTVLAYNGTTHAWVDAGAKVRATGNVRIEACDKTDSDMVAGAAGLGFAAVGFAGSVGVVVIDKDTQAWIGQNATVEAFARGPNSLTVFSGGGDLLATTSIKGLSVQAHSQEDVLTVGAAGAGGFVGLAGAVGVDIINSNTSAHIDGGAKINREQNDADAAQSVNVSAVNQANATTFILGIAGGLVGVAGAVDVGTIRNDVSAFIGEAAEVHAKNDVDVNALGDRDVFSIVVSAAGGVVGLGASVSVWSIGAQFDPNVTYQEQQNKATDAKSDAEQIKLGTKSANLTEGEFKNADGSTRKQTTDDAAGESTAMAVGQVAGLINRFRSPSERTGLTAANPSEPSNDTPAFTGITEARNRVVSGGTTPTISGTPTKDNIVGSLKGKTTANGVTAFVAKSAAVTVGDDLNIRARERIEASPKVGSGAAGLGGLGASVTIVTVTSQTQAHFDGTLTANGDLLIFAGLDENIGSVSRPGNSATQGSGTVAVGLVALGATVVVVHDNSSQQAWIADGATVTQANGVSVIADNSIEQNVSSFTATVALGAVGAAITHATAIGKTEAWIGDADIGPAIVTNPEVGGTPADTIGGVIVRTTPNIELTTSAVALGSSGLVGGAGVDSRAVATPTITTEIRDGASVNTAGVVQVTSQPEISATADALGAQVAGGLAVGVSISEATVAPTIVTRIGAANVEADLEVMVVTLFNSKSVGLFNPQSVVNDPNDTLTFAQNHGLTTGDALIYSHGPGGQNINGLSDGTIYYVVVVNPSTIQLAKSRNEALAATPTTIRLSLSGTDRTQHRFFQGAYAKGNSSSGSAIGGNGVQSRSQVGGTLTTAAGGTGSSLRTLQNLTIRTDAEYDALTDARGLTIGIAAGIGIIDGRATVDPTVTTELRGGTYVTANLGRLTIRGNLRRRADVRGDAPGAAGLFGLAGVSVGATVGGRAETSAATGSTITSRDIELLTITNDSATADANALSIGAIALGFTDARTLLSATTATHLDATVANVQEVTVQTTATQLAKAESEVSSGGLIAAQASTAIAEVGPFGGGPSIATDIRSPSLVASGNVIVRSVVVASADADALSGLSFGLVGAVGAMTATATLRPDIDTSIDLATAEVGAIPTLRTTGGGITVETFYNVDDFGAPLAGREANARAQTPLGKKKADGSFDSGATLGGLFNLQSTRATAISSALVNTFVGSNTALDSFGNVNVRSQSANSAVADSLATGNVGLFLTVGKTVAFTEVRGETFADLLGQVTQSASVSVRANGLGKARSNTEAAAGGVVGVSGTDAQSHVATSIRSRIADNVTATGDVDLVATSKMTSDATGLGAAAGVLVGVGDVFSEATVMPTVTVQVLDGVTVESTTGSIRLRGDHNVDDNGVLVVASGAHATSTASGGGVLGGGTKSNATARNTPNVLVEIGGLTTIKSAQDLLVQARGDETARAVSTGAVFGFAASGSDVTSTAESRGRVTAQMSPSLGEIKNDLTVIARRSGSTESKAIPSAVAIIGAGVSAVATTTVDSGGYGPSTDPKVKAFVGGSVLHVGRVETGDELNPTRRFGTATILAQHVGYAAAEANESTPGGALGTGGGVTANLTWRPVVRATISDGTTLTAERDIFVQAYNNHADDGSAITTQDSGLVASAIGDGVGVFGGGREAKSVVTLSPDVQSVVGLQTSLRAGLGISLDARSRTGLTEIAMAHFAGLAGKAGATLEATIGGNVLAATTSTTDVSMRAKLDATTFVNMIARQSLFVGTNCEAITNAAFAAAPTVTRLQLVDRFTRAVVGANTRIDVPGGALTLEATSQKEVMARSKSVGRFFGGAIQALRQPSMKVTGRDVTEATIATSAQIPQANNIFVRAKDPLVIDAQDERTALDGSDGEVVSDVSVDAISNAVVQVDPGSMLNATEGVNLEASFDGARTIAKAKALPAGDGSAPAFATAENLKQINAVVDVARSARITTPSLNVSTIVPRFETGGFLRVAETDQPAQIVSELRTVGQSSRHKDAVLDAFGRTASPYTILEPVTATVLREIGTANQVYLGGETINSTIDFDGMVVLPGRGLSPKLTVNFDGVITELDGLSISDGTTPLNLGDTVTTDRIVLGDVIAQPIGSVIFNNSLGTITGTPTLQFLPDIDGVTIVNQSDRHLELGRLSTFAPRPDQTALCLDGGTLTLQPQLVVNPEDALIDVLNEGPGQIVVSQNIYNPNGPVRIRNLVGPVVKSGTPTIVTDSLQVISEGQPSNVLDDALPPQTPLTISIADVSRPESFANLDFVVTLSRFSGQPVTVAFVTSPGSAVAPSDFGHMIGTLQFTAGEIQKSINVGIRGDALFEPNETMFVTLSNANGATIADGQAIGTIANDDSPPAGDEDNDGIAAAIEDQAPHDGDGNRDGIPDREQTNVASLPSAADGVTVTLATPDGTNLAQVQITTTPPAGAPEEIEFPLGVFEFSVTELPAGVSTVVTIFLPAGMRPTTYFKFGPEPQNPATPADETIPHWYEFLFDGTTGAEILADRILLHLLDGGRGDSDLSANGRISDPGAPGMPAETIVTVVLPNVNNNVTVSRQGNALLVRNGTVNLIPPTLVADIDVLQINGGTAADQVRLDRSLNGYFIGRVEFQGNAGNDRFDGRAVNAAIVVKFQGGEGHDTAMGGPGNDTLDGGNGNDSLLSYTGADVLIGSMGNDRGDAGFGNDLILGGAGNDSFLGGDGRDTLCGDLDNDTLDGGNGADVVIGDQGDDSLSGGNGEDTLLGQAGNDVLNGNNDNDTLAGGNDHDRLRGGAGDDRLLGESGNDTANGNAGNDQIDGGSGADSLLGDVGNDTLFGGADRDTIRGGNGNDSIAGGAGQDSLAGDRGTDTVRREVGIDTVTSAENQLADGLNEAFTFDLGTLLDLCAL